MQGTYHKWGEAQDGLAKQLVYRPDLGRTPLRTK